jgi:hypothetical protein
MSELIHNAPRETRYGVKRMIDAKSKQTTEDECGENYREIKLQTDFDQLEPKFGVAFERYERHKR